MEAIRDSAVYANEEEGGQLPELYYLVFWKGYPESENTWELASAVMHLRKMIRTFHKDHPEKSTATSPPIDSAPPMAKPSANPLVETAKRKRDRPPKNQQSEPRNFGRAE